MEDPHDLPAGCPVLRKIALQGHQLYPMCLSHNPEPDLGAADPKWILRVALWKESCRHDPVL